MLQPAQLVQLARVALDIQDRCIEAFIAGGGKAYQVRHELFEQYLLTYQVRLVDNGFEHQLAACLDGTIEDSLAAAVRADTLRILAYVVRIARLGPVYPFDVTGLRLAVSRVLTPDESKRLQRKPDLGPPETQAAALFVASEGDAAKLQSHLPAR